MARCARCCLRNAMTGANAVATLCGVGMIVYSLWLERMWKLGVSHLPTVTNLPKPWFIYTCLAVGIAVCLSTLLGHMIAARMSNSSLCTYLVTLSSLLLLEAAVLVMIFFKIDWSKLILKYIDEHHTEFRSFVKFHVSMIRLIMLTVMVLQIIIAVFATILFAIGTEPQTRHRILSVPDFDQSFLVGPIPAVSEEPIQVQDDQVLLMQSCSRRRGFCRRNLRASLLSYAKSLILTTFRRRITVE